MLRMLFGVALGGQWGVGASLCSSRFTSEMAWPSFRLLQEGYTLGNLLAAIAFRTVYPHYGWRSLFY